MQEEWDGENQQTLIHEIRKWRVEIPGEVGEENEPLYADEEVLEHIATQVSKTPTFHVRSIVQAVGEEKEGNTTIQTLIETLHKDYDGVVLRPDVPPENIIKRGPYGEGTIEIKPGYPPKNQRPIHLTGERREALIELVKSWVKDGKVEEGRSEWSSPAFVVAKKGTSKWRGVVDFRALNEATATDTYPLPRIEDMLVNFGKKSNFHRNGFKRCIPPGSSPVRL